MAIEYNPENCVISVGVSDYDRSLAWYRDVLGFELVYELKEYGWCELKTPFGFNIGLGQTETGRAGQRHADVRRARHRRGDRAICARTTSRSRTGTRSRRWCGSRRSTTPTARRGCSRRRSSRRRRFVAN